MVSITFVGINGVVKSVDASPGQSVMEVARAAGVEGIEAQCGGCCACATCHVYIEAPFSSLLEPMAELEETMLDFAEHVEPSSRLSCQIQISEAFEGMIVRAAEP